MVLVWALHGFGQNGITAKDRAGEERACVRGKRLGLPPFSAADRKKLIAVLDTGKRRRPVSAATAIRTVQKHPTPLG